MSTRTRTTTARQLLTGGALIAGTLVGSPLLRRWYNRWGATDDEVARPLPGDDLVKHPKLTYTRAITVAATSAISHVRRMGRPWRSAVTATDRPLGSGIGSIHPPARLPDLRRTVELRQRVGTRTYRRSGFYLTAVPSCCRLSAS